MDAVAGALLIVIGAVVLIFGAQRLNVKEGTILKLFSNSHTNLRLIRWGFGLGAIYIGVGLILGWFQ